jgi:hypothetical protein
VMCSLFLHYRVLLRVCTRKRYVETACVCVRVFEREREREGGRKSEREGGREEEMQYVLNVIALVRSFVRLCVC